MDSNAQPVVSIITPVYNVEKYLNRCIESVVNQSFKNFELILIDDGSTDGSSSICDDWARKDNRIKVIHQINAGAGAARNRGLVEAKGNYIGFVDSDDWIELDMYELLISAFETNMNIDMAECETFRTRGDKSAVKNSHEAVSFEVINREGLLRSFFRVNGGDSNFGIYTKLIKKHVLKDFKFIEGTISEDVMASYYFYTHCNKAVRVNKKLYNYFQNEAGVTRKKVTRRDFEYIEAFKRISEDIKLNMPSLQEYAEINYIRSNFTILSKMKLVGYDKTNENLMKQYKDIKKIVRSNFGKLMRWKMPLSRKILLIWVCI